MVAEQIKDIMQEYGLMDAWRTKNPHKKGFTWHQMRPKAIFCRLDMWWTPKDLMGLIDTCKIIPAVQTDHSAVLLKLKGKIMSHEDLEYGK